MSTDKIITDFKKVFRPKKTFWNKLGSYVKDWIRQDMIAGFCQAYTANMKYLSAQYVKYKRNFMNRFTTDKRGTAGTKLKAYSGRSVRSNNTDKVNMYLTGETIEGLTWLPQEDHTLMQYKTNIEGIKGNAALGRHIATLTKENQEQAKKLIREEILKAMREYASKKEVIKI